MNLINLPKSLDYMDGNRWSNRLSYPLVVEYWSSDPFVMSRVWNSVNMSYLVVWKY